MTLRLVTADRQPLAARYALHVFAPSGRQVARHTDLTAPEATIDDLAPAELYRVEVWPRHYRRVAAHAFGDSTVVVPCPLDPGATLRVVWPDPIPVDLAPLWSELSDLARASLLNLYAKLQAVHLWGHIVAVTGVEPDRIFAEVTADLGDVLEGSPEFVPVSGILHTPPPGARPAGSYKHTPYDVGVLQITLFRADDTWLADIDLDDAGGIGHVFQVLGHWATGGATHPYDMHQVLTFYQRIHPGYHLHAEAA